MKTDSNFKLLWSRILTNINSDEKSIKEITVDELENIRSIGGKYTPSGVKALNILKYAFNEEHEELFDEVDEFYYKLMLEEGQ